MSERDAELLEEHQQSEDRNVIDKNSNNVKEYFGHYFQEFTESAAGTIVISN